MGKKPSSSMRPSGKRPSRKRGSGGAGKPPGLIQKSAQSKKRGKVRHSGVLVLLILAGAILTTMMVGWALVTVQPVVRRYEGHDIAMVSSRETILVDPGRAGSAQSWPTVLSTRGLSTTAIRSVLLSSGLTESPQPAPRTFALQDQSRSARITLEDGTSVTLTRQGALVDAAGQPIPKLSLGNAPLGSRSADDDGLGQPLASRRVPLAAFSPHIANAVIAIEDERFDKHFGIDLIGIARALVINISAGRVVQGGSTLTQQLAKNLFLNADRSFSRKFKELFLSVALELKLSKAQLLELYLNEVYLGAEGGVQIHGVPAAARWLFNKSPAQLTLSESAQIAGIIQAPNAYNPKKRPKLAEQRRLTVLDRMHDTGMINSTIYQSAVTQLPHVATGGKAPTTSGITSENELGAYVPGLVRARNEEPFYIPRATPVETTISAPLQRCAEFAVDSGSSDFARRSKRRIAPQIALTAMTTNGREIVAYVGGTNFTISRVDYARATPRQLGSTVKPFVYARALERGIVSLHSAIEDSPLEEDFVPGWNPQNFDEQFRGLVTVRYALENSLNIPAIRLGKAVGFPAVARIFNEMHLPSETVSAYPSLAIGAVEGTLLNLTAAYAGLSAGGTYQAPTILADRFREIPVLSKGAAFLVTNTLQGVVQRGTAGKALSDLRQVVLAGKTGTSNEGRDAWFAGYTPDIAVGVWIGYPDNRSLGQGITGGSIAAPIAKSFFQCAEGLIPARPFTIPDDVRLELVPGDEDREAVEEFFLNGVEELDSEHRR